MMERRGRYEVSRSRQILTGIGMALLAVASRPPEITGADVEQKSSNRPRTVSQNQISDVLTDYQNVVRQDAQLIASEFSASSNTDLFGEGYTACVVDSDCLTPEQACVAGVKPNTTQEPGYCVPKGR